MAEWGEAHEHLQHWRNCSEQNHRGSNRHPQRWDRGLSLRPRRNRSRRWNDAECDVGLKCSNDYDPPLGVEFASCLSWLPLSSRSATSHSYEPFLVGVCDSLVSFLVSIARALVGSFQFTF